DSVLAGLESIDAEELVIVHDAARPLVTAGLAGRVLAAAERVGAAVPALKVPDTLVRSRGERVEEIVSREGVLAVQTPQAFRREVLARAHASAPPDWDAPDDGSMVARLGEPVATVDGEPDNFKITWPDDVQRAEAILTARGSGPGDREDVRIGLGWDVHPLVPGRAFRLLGVELTTELGPVGHSDGDPLSHAVADALLGAAAMGDIGLLFPDDDPGCAGLSGSDLLGTTVDALRQNGYAPLQVDAVIVTDRPRLAPFRDRVRGRLAEILGVPLDAVSVKGKRTEGLGGLAGGAGVACHALARIRRTGRP
ncbi:MAG: 2-C-methyl-D-erythritol 2,4-cyclodiphosphate synthase, partial [Acidobacteriota bacterium]|nr:2-C-methyl-D-erythritol 2,4-cyclodiphosphate synthase [Acidobacteriota bacterium]